MCDDGFGRFSIYWYWFISFNKCSVPTEVETNFNREYNNVIEQINTLFKTAKIDKEQTLFSITILKQSTLSSVFYQAYCWLSRLENLKG